MRWTVLIEFPDLPDDADVQSVSAMTTALLDSNGVVEYNLLEVEQNDEDE